MVTSSGHQSRLELACEPPAPWYARAHAKDILPRWGLPRTVVEDALTIVSELATNAVRHTGAPAVPHDHGSRPEVRLCALSLMVIPGWLYIGVYDEARLKPPVLRPPSEYAETGRGVALVHGLTEGEWGWSPSAGKPGKVVWARLKLDLPNAQDVGPRVRPLGVSA